MTIEQDLQRAQHAKRLLDDSLLTEAFEQIRVFYMREWEASPARDAEGREKLWLMLKLLERVKGHLHVVLDGGKLAAKQLETQEKTTQRKKKVTRKKR